MDDELIDKIKTLYRLTIGTNHIRFEVLLSRLPAESRAEFLDDEIRAALAEIRRRERWVKLVEDLNEI